MKIVLAGVPYLAKKPWPSAIQSGATRAFSAACAMTIFPGADAARASPLSQKRQAQMITSAARIASEVEQPRGVLAENLILLPRGEIFALADAGHGVRVLRVELRIVRRHQDMVLADLGDRPREILLVRLAGEVAVAAHIFRRRPQLEGAGELREVLRPVPVVVHAVHPVERKLGAALEEGDFELGK